MELFKTYILKLLYTITLLFMAYFLWSYFNYHVNRIEISI